MSNCRDYYPENEKQEEMVTITKERFEELLRSHDLAEKIYKTFHKDGYVYIEEEK